MALLVMVKSASGMDEQLMQAVQQEVEQHGAHLLVVALCGSRAFGYASPQSDYDLRFIYAYPLNRYLSISPVKTELRLKGMDIVGYELGKFLSMAAGNGWTAPELVRSPIWYETPMMPGLVGELTQLSQAVFAPAPAVHSLLSCAKTYGKRLAHLSEGEQNNSDALVKMNLGRLRVLLAALYLQQHGCFYPVLLRDLVSVVCPDILPAVSQLSAWRAGQASPSPQEWFCAMAAVRALIDELSETLLEPHSSLPTLSSDTVAMVDAYYLQVVKRLG